MMASSNTALRLDAAEAGRVGDASPTQSRPASMIACAKSFGLGELTPMRYRYQQITAWRQVFGRARAASPGGSVATRALLNFSPNGGKNAEYRALVEFCAHGQKSGIRPLFITTVINAESLPK
jgi:hypothetical protein